MKNFSNKIDYDPLLDTQLARLAPQVVAFIKHAPQWKRELSGHRLSVFSKDNSARVSRVRETRERAERRAAQTVKDVVRILQFTLSELQETPTPSRYESSVNVQKVHNAVYELIHKCGVKFSEDEASFQKVKLDRAIDG